MVIFEWNKNVITLLQYYFLCNRAITDSRYYEALPLSGVPSAWRGTNLEELLAIRFLVVALVQTLVALLSV